MIFSNSRFGLVLAVKLGLPTWHSEENAAGMMTTLQVLRAVHVAEDSA